MLRFIKQSLKYSISYTPVFPCCIAAKPVIIFDIQRMLLVAEEGSLAYLKVPFICATYLLLLLVKIHGKDISPKAGRLFIDQILSASAVNCHEYFFLLEEGLIYSRLLVIHSCDIKGNRGVLRCYWLIKCYMHLPLQILLQPIISKGGDLVVSTCNCF